MELSTTDLNAIRAKADDEIVRCEECRRILVRVADSGL
jgi:predicted  nucleic acid-binding Zn-ribbon protein